MNDLLSSSAPAALWACLVIATASSSISITVTETELFAPWRAWTAKVHYKLGYLFSCFYCLSHWVVFLGVAVYRPVLVSSGRLAVDLIVSAFFTVALSTFISGFMYTVFMTAMRKKLKEKEFKELLGRE